MKRKRISESSAASLQPDAVGTTSSEEYDVFLNFRGSDTRYGFVDCLYQFLKEAGIHVFLDNEALRVGDDIGDELRTAIDSSRLYIPIFSRNYASSKWCLIELARMVERARKSDGKGILPVFFDVEPEDVKLKTDLYTEDLLRHEESFGSHKVRNWRKALRKVSKMKGWNLQSNQGQGTLISEITEHIGHRLKLKHRILPNHFIGITKQAQDIMDALDCGSGDVRFVVIHGMGGIGKTTLASVVFNKIYRQFKECSFLSNVRESSAGNGIVNLQNKFQHDTHRFSPRNFCDANDAMNYLQTSLRNKHVLVVLDDVSNIDQIRNLIGMGDWVGLGSRVIITTRNLSSIANVDEIEKNVVRGKKIYIHRMRELGFNSSLQLLCRHAFGKDSPPHGYEQLSHDILSFTKGIPLAIEVIGSYLKGKRNAIWKEMLTKLEKVPNDRLYQDILMSTYEMLCDEEKKIFLDIAFFFAGHDKTNASYYWDACNLFTETSIDTLISYALVKIVSPNTFWMHDIIRDLGREVDRKESNGNLGRRSRLCNEDAKRLLLKAQGTEYVKALKLDSTHSHNFTPAQLSGLSDLQFLELCGGNFIGEFGDNCLSELKWLSWRNCPLDFRGNNLNFEKLVVLKLSESKITDIWAGWEQLKTAISLKVLELKRLNLIATPDLSSFSSLERLVVRSCKRLVQINPSIGNLECLDSLKVINSCPWPSDLIRNENRLKILHLPGSICNLKALSRLKIVGFKLKKLPGNIGELKGLKVMQIKGCESLRNLPDSIGDLEFLCELHLPSAGITKLPESIGKLGNLTKLNVSHNKLRRLPATIGDLVRLEILDASDNKYLEGEIPSEFGRLKSLEYLDLSGTRIRGLPTSIHQLSRLQSLTLVCCNQIQELPDLPTGLTKLWISSWSLKAAPKLSRVTKLVLLFLSNNGNQEVLTCNVTDYLSVGFDQLSRLRELSLSCLNPNVMRLLPSGLNSLSLNHSTSLSSWERLSHLKGLSTLRLYKSSDTEIRIDGLESLNNLTRLEIRGCELLERIHDISRLQKLQNLVIINCPKLVEIGGLTQPLESLKYLFLSCCNSIRCLPDRSGTESSSVLRLDVSGCSKLRSFIGPYDSYSQESEEANEMNKN